MLAHIRAALRPFHRTPVRAWTIALTLAMGIGLASATGVIARGIAFAGLPVRDADRVVMLWGADRAGSITHMPLRPLELPPLSEALRGVATVAASDYNGASDWVFRPLDGGAAPLRMRGALAGGTFFDVLDTRPILGRALHADDDVIGAARVIVLSHSAWQRHFGGDTAVLGRALQSVQFGSDYRVVGVMPPGLDVPRGVDFWSALAPTAARNGSLAESFWNVDVLARLAPGATAEQARLILTSYYQTLAAQGARHMVGATASVRTIPELVSGDVRPAFRALAWAALVVLLVTCGNVGALLLLRAAERRRELAVRAAIGASRGRIARELVEEHVALAAVGGLLGAAVAAMIVRAFVALAPRELPRVADLGLDWTVLVAVLVVTAIVVLVIGVAPALIASRVPPATMLGGGREGAGGRSLDVRLRRSLVVAQVAMAFVVLAGATLTGRSLDYLATLDLGMSAADDVSFVELVQPAPAPAALATADGLNDARMRWRATLDAVLEGVSAMPGITAAAPVAKTPFSGVGGWDVKLGPEGAAADDSIRRPYLNMEITNDAYLRTTGLPLQRGRWLSASDREDSPRVVVLSARAASMLFPGEDAVGRRIDGGGRVMTVVGVVGDSRYREFVEPRPSVYIPHRQFEMGATVLAIRGTGDPALLVHDVRRVAREVNPALLVQEGGTLRGLMSIPLARPRLLASVLAAYAVVVVALAVAGLYAVIAGSVRARRREFGVRAALGATPGALLTQVMGEGMRMTLVGAVVGLAVALAAGRLVAALLHGVTPNDPGTLLVVALALGAGCAAAVAVPAMRSARTDPARALRAE